MSREEERRGKGGLGGGDLGGGGEGGKRGGRGGGGGGGKKGKEGIGRGRGKKIEGQKKEKLKKKMVNTRWPWRAEELNFKVRRAFAVAFPTQGRRGVRWLNDDPAVDAERARYPESQPKTDGHDAEAENTNRAEHRFKPVRFNDIRLDTPRLRSSKDWSRSRGLSYLGSAEMR